METVEQSMAKNIKAFVRQSNTPNLGYKPYINYYKGLNVKTSFGQGTPAYVSWICIKGERQETSRGINVSCLYYKNNKVLVIAYGISEENEPTIEWNLPSSTPTIKEYFKKNNLGRPDRYKTSYVYKVYNDSTLNFDTIVADLDNLISIYKEVLENNSLNRETAFVAPDPRGNGKKKEFFDESLFASSIGITLESNLDSSTISSSYPNYWIYAPGDDASKWDMCKKEGYMCLGWDEVGDLSIYESKEDIVAVLQDVYNEPNNSFKHASLALYQFCHGIKVGDIIYVKKGQKLIIGKGIVTSEYKFDEAKDEFKNIRLVNWIDSGLWESPCILPQKTLTLLKKKKIKSLENLFSTNKSMEQIPLDISKVSTVIKETGLLYDSNLITRFAYSLITKPFVILSGLAGSGKTQLAVAFAKSMVEDEKKQMRVVSVGADWTNREPLLGFPNALQEGQYMHPESGVLNLLIECNKKENADKPFFLILDEMNLSYVERYFADFLSAMESHVAIPLWKGSTSDNTPKEVSLPGNLFIIGTINVDETTYMFSPKVLDRANVIEFKVEKNEMVNFLKEAPIVNIENICGKASDMANDFVTRAKNKVEPSNIANETLIKFFTQLKEVNAEFGYRSATEIGRFISLSKNDLSDDEAIDAAIVQKLMPKLHGSRKKIVPVLKELWKLCGDTEDIEEKEKLEVSEGTKYPLTADKIIRMYKSAVDNGFTSFAEA